MEYIYIYYDESTFFLVVILNQQLARTIHQTKKGKQSGKKKKYTSSFSTPISIAIFYSYIHLEKRKNPPPPRTLYPPTKILNRLSNLRTHTRTSNTPSINPLHNLLPHLRKRQRYLHHVAALHVFTQQHGCQERRPVQCVFDICFIHLLDPELEGVWGGWGVGGGGWGLTDRNSGSLRGSMSRGFGSPGPSPLRSCPDRKRLLHEEGGVGFAAWDDLDGD